VSTFANVVEEHHGDILVVCFQKVHCEFHGNVGPDGG